MYRKNKKTISYKKEDIEIRVASLDEEYEIGIWTSSYDWIKIGYEYDKYESKYSDINYVMIYNDNIIGYFMAYEKINDNNTNTNIPLYSKELVVYDFVVDIRAYAKFSKILIDFMIKYATNNGYNAISFYKLEECNEFNKFINRHYNIKEFDDKYYLFIDKPIIKSHEKYLTIYYNDKLSIEDLYFLYDLNFNVLKTKCKIKLNDYEQITIDRRTGIITFPSNVDTTSKVVLNKYTKTLVYIIIGMYYVNEIKNVSINYDINNPHYYETNIGGLLYVSKELNEIRKDKDYITSLIETGINEVVPNQLRYEINGRSFTDSKIIYKLTK